MMTATVFDVWAHVAGKMHRIDLIEEADRLDREELVAVKADLRLAHCKEGADQSTRDIASVALVFLDPNNMMFRKVRRGPSGWRSPSRRLS
jgi:hypothetical protein